MLAPNTLNKKPAAATDHDGLYLVSRALSPLPGKDEDHELVHPHGTCV